MTGAVSSRKAREAAEAPEAGRTARGDRAPTGPNPAAAWFVWGAFALMLLGNLALVLRFTSPYPLSDEVTLLFQSITPAWLWELHAEHRVPLAKLVWLGVLELTDYDFRAVNVVSVLSIAAAAAAMIVGAGRLRGGLRYSDAFFPLAMLSFGQMRNFLWPWVLNHILPNVVACFLLLTVVLKGRQSHLRDTFLVVAILVLLFLSGPIGLPYVLAFSAWIAHRAIVQWRAPGEYRGRRDGLISLVLALCCVAMVGLYFVDWHGRSVSGVGMSEALKSSFRILCVSFGPAVTAYVRPLGLTLLGLLLASAVVLVRTWLGRPGERLRVSGLFLLLSSTGALLLTVGLARAGHGWQYQLGGTYLTMAIPALCATYYVGIIYARPAIGELTQVILFTLSCLFFLPNLQRGSSVCSEWHEKQEAVQRDLHDGVPVSLIAARRYEQFGVFPPVFPTERLVGALRKYRERGIPQFRGMALDPAFREVRIPVKPAALDDVVWKDGVGYSCSSAPEAASLHFSLDRPRFVYAIQVQCSYESDIDGWAEPTLTWDADNAAEPRDGSALRASNRDRMKVRKTPYSGFPGDTPVHRPQVITFWVNAKVDRFRLHPDTKPFAFKIREIVLLVPPVDSPVRGPKP
jgi:hypothetical protein